MSALPIIDSFKFLLPFSNTFIICVILKKEFLGKALASIYPMLLSDVLLNMIGNEDIRVYVTQVVRTTKKILIKASIYRPNLLFISVRLDLMKYGIVLHTDSLCNLY